MTKTVSITTISQLNTLLSSSKIVILNFQAPSASSHTTNTTLYDELASHLARSKRVTFAAVNSEAQPEIAQLYNIASFPTFKIFKNAQIMETIEGVDRTKLSNVVRKIAAEADGDGAEGFGEPGGGYWLGAALPKGYKDITDQVDMRGLDLLNADSAFGAASDLFAKGQPGKIEAGAAGDKKDWVESDTDEQLMLFMPFQATLKVHSLHITSLSTEDGDSETSRPKTIRLYKNRAHTLGFDEADDIEATQTIELQPGDWDSQTSTARIELRFVKFQNITSLVLFVVDGEDDSEKTRIDRIRLIGDSGEKRDMGKLEKVGEGSE